MTGDDLIGHDVNVAARVAEEAAGGEVLTTAHLRDEVGVLRGVAFGPVRSLALKGLDEPVAVCQVLAAPAHPSEPPAPTV